MKERKQREFTPSFGRLKARPFSSMQKDAFENHLKNYLITSENISQFIKENKNHSIYIEIGFGMGEHLIHLAKNNPDKIIIGCEVFLNGVAKATAEIVKNKLTNVYIFKDDCRELLKRLPENFVNKIYILFPDPWPKRRHEGKRLINQITLDLIKNIMKEGAILRFASDDKNYFTKGSELIKKQECLKEIFNSLKEYKIPEDHLKTKYQSIADRAGRVSNFFEAKKYSK